MQDSGGRRDHMGVFRRGLPMGEQLVGGIDKDMLADFPKGKLADGGA